MKSSCKHPIEFLHAASHIEDPKASVVVKQTGWRWCSATTQAENPDRLLDAFKKSFNLTPPPPCVCFVTEKNKHGLLQT